MHINTQAVVLQVVYPIILLNTHGIYAQQKGRNTANIVPEALQERFLCIDSEEDCVS